MVMSLTTAVAFAAREEPEDRLRRLRPAKWPRVLPDAGVTGRTAFRLVTGTAAELHVAVGGGAEQVGPRAVSVRLSV